MSDPRLASRNIVADFPEMFSEAFDVSLPNGWYSAVWECCAEIHRIAPETRVSQIKEKFGTLCFYPAVVVGGEVAVLIRRAELTCDKTCQRCGAPGKIGSKRHWLSTLCEECRSVQA